MRSVPLNAEKGKGMFEGMSDLDRRAFLAQAGLFGLAGNAAAWAEPAKLDLILREKNPLNLEFPFRSLKNWITPNRIFFVRNHYAQPKLNLKTWRLEVTGAVKKPLKLTLDQLQKLKEVKQPITLECAGNGRSFLSPKAKGVQWDLGAISTADWTGVPLAAVLDLAEVKPGAVDVILDGADKGDPKKDGQPDGLLSFARGLPLVKARKPEVMLAWGMNGLTLPAEHGFPLRAVVGGWYGMASIKWLSRIIVTTRPFKGYEQTMDYSVWTDLDGLPTLTPITQMEVKASIARPSPGEVIMLGKAYRIHGAAWAGENNVSKVEFSSDEGKTWVVAKLLGKAIPFCWQLWEHEWKPAAVGNAALLVRATDSRGRTQPLKRDPNRRNYVINHLVPTKLTVRDA
jgi:DMSO/TMAO reductase YedYZ molybdopterin-dependent catalytic subunit